MSTVVIYKINGRRYIFVSVNPLYWVLSDEHGTTWHAYGPVIKPRMHLVRGDA